MLRMKWRYPNRAQVRLLLVAAGCVILTICTPVAAHADGEKEYEVKAAFIFNFAKFVEWPARAFNSSESPFVVAVVGKDPFGGSLAAALRGKEVAGRSIVLKRFNWDDDMKGAHVLFIASEDPDRLSRVSDSVKGYPILTIGESRGFAPRYGIIGFTVEKKRVRFEINLDAARRAGLTVSSRLLSLAKVVGDAK